MSNVPENISESFRAKPKIEGGKLSKYKLFSPIVLIIHGVIKFVQRLDLLHKKWITPLTDIVRERRHPKHNYHR